MNNVKIKYLFRNFRYAAAMYWSGWAGECFSPHSDKLVRCVTCFTCPHWHVTSIWFIFHVIFQQLERVFKNYICKSLFYVIECARKYFVRFCCDQLIRHSKFFNMILGICWSVIYLRIQLCFPENDWLSKNIFLNYGCK